MGQLHHYSRVRVAPDHETTERALRTLLLTTCAGAGYPAEADAWKDVARREPRAPMPWAKLQRMTKATVQRAAGRNREAIVDFYMALLADALEGADAPAPVPFPRILREESEAMAAQSVATAEPTPQHLTDAERETREAIAASEFYLAAMRAPRLALAR